MAVRSKSQVTLERIKLKTNPYRVIGEELKIAAVGKAKDRLYEEARKEAAKLRVDILQQRIPMAPLNTKYLAWKKRQGKDTRILIADGYYVAQIKARMVGDAIVVGIGRGVHPTAKMSYEKLARIMEYGSEKRGIPPRAHWAISRARFMKEYPRLEEELNQIAAQDLSKALMSKLGKKK